jgi:hypothetical protein
MGKMQRLRYVNCGHLSGLVLRHDDTLERRDSTCTVLGIFKEWDFSTGERLLSAGDTFALYTGGVTESFNDAGGTPPYRIAATTSWAASPVLVASIVDDIKKFSPHGQSET